MFCLLAQPMPFEEIIEIAAFNSTRKGGDCAVREVIELVMKEQGKWMKIF